MSINRFVQQGKLGDGLNLEVRSINTDLDASSFIRGNLTVGKILDVIGDTTCEKDLTVVQDLKLFGQLEMDNKKVMLNGIQTQAQQQLVTSLEIFNYGSFPFRYERYGDTLHVSGVFYGDIFNISNSKSFSVFINVPVGYQLSPPYTSAQYYPVSGNGIFALGTGTSSGSYITGVCFPVTASQYRITFNTCTGNNVLNNNGQVIFSFSVFLNNIVDL